LVEVCVLLEFEYQIKAIVFGVLFKADILEVAEDRTILLENFWVD